MRRDRIEILNTQIDVLDVKQTVEVVKQYLKEKKPLHLMGVNADKINMLNRNKKLKRIVNDCEIINADGASVILASRYLGTPLPERVAGIDLMQLIVAVAEQEGYKVFLLGARQEIVDKTARVLRDTHPSLQIVGKEYVMGIFQKEQWKEVAESIRKSGADIVFGDYIACQKSTW